jgi:hypothetical protein
VISVVVFSTSVERFSLERGDRNVTLVPGRNVENKIKRKMVNKIPEKKKLGRPSCRIITVRLSLI